jgi:hypothetical protein
VPETAPPETAGHATVRDGRATRGELPRDNEHASDRPQHASRATAAFAGASVWHAACSLGVIASNSFERSPMEETMGNERNPDLEEFEPQDAEIEDEEQDENEEQYDLDDNQEDDRGA